MLLRRSLFRAPVLAQRAFRVRAAQPPPGSFEIHTKDAKEQEIVENVTGIPHEILSQVAIIGKPPPTSTQSIDYLNYWEIRFPEGKNWEDSLMGWTKSNGVTRWARDLLQFPSRESAIDFCERNALSYQVENERPVIYNNKNYGDKFKHRGVKKPEAVDLV